MNRPIDLYATARSMTSLGDIDLEIARLALICGVRILDPGVAERVVRDDASVCETSSPVAFDKLHGLLALHFGVRGSVAEALGQELASGLEQKVIDRLRTRFPALAGGSSPGGR